MKKYCVFRIEKKKNSQHVGASHRHNLRIGKQNKHVNRSLSNQNISMRKDNDYSLIDKVNQRMATSDIKSGKPVPAVECLFSFSSEWWESKSKKEQQQLLPEWRRKTIKWAAETFGGKENIADWHLHLDEQTPHLHLIFVPNYEKTLKDGSKVKRLSAKHYCHGKDKLASYHTSYANAMAEFGLERGLENSGATHQTIAEFQRGLTENKKQANEAYKKFTKDFKSLKSLTLRERSMSKDTFYQERLKPLAQQYIKAYKALQTAVSNAETALESKSDKLDNASRELGNQKRKYKSLQNKLEKMGLGDLENMNDQQIAQIKVEHPKPEPVSKHHNKKEEEPEYIKTFDIWDNSNDISLQKDLAEELNDSHSPPAELKRKKLKM